MPIPGNFVDNAIVFATNLDEKAPAKRKILRQLLTLTGTAVEQDFTSMTNRHEFGDIRAIIIDWSLGTSQLIITSLSAPAIKIAPGYMAVVPIPMCSDNTLTFMGTGTLDFALTNTDTKVGAWNTNGGSSSGFGNNADGVAPVTSGLQATDAFSYFWDPTNLDWSRAVLDASAPSPAGLAYSKFQNSVLTKNAMMAYNVSGAGMNYLTLGAPADSLARYTSLFVASYPVLYNGTTSDQQRGNVSTPAVLTLTGQAAGSVSSAAQINFNGRGIIIAYDITALGASTTVQFFLNMIDANGDPSITLASSAAIAVTGTGTLVMYPGINPVANQAISLPLPRNYKIIATVAGTNTATVDVSTDVIL